MNIIQEIFESPNARSSTIVFLCVLLALFIASLIVDMIEDNRPMPVQKPKPHIPTSEELLAAQYAIARKELQERYAEMRKREQDELDDLY